MTEETNVSPNASLSASTIDDARNKLETVAQIMAHIQAQGVHDVSIDLVEALLVPARQALADEERSDLDEKEAE